MYSYANTSSALTIPNASVPQNYASNVYKNAANSVVLFYDNVSDITSLVNNITYMMMIVVVVVYREVRHAIISIHNS